MPKHPPADFYKLGRAFYALYLLCEAEGTDFHLLHESNGRITSPEGMADLINRTAQVRLEQPGDMVTFHANPKHDVHFTKEDYAEGGSGGSTRPQASQGEAGDAGQGQEREGPAEPAKPVADAQEG